MQQKTLAMAAVACKDALLDIPILRQFVGIDLEAALRRKQPNRPGLPHGNEQRYRGLQKHATRAFTVLALSYIFMSRGHLMAQVRP